MKFIDLEQEFAALYTGMIRIPFSITVYITPDDENSLLEDLQVYSGNFKDLASLENDFEYTLQSGLILKFELQ